MFCFGCQFKKENNKNFQTVQTSTACFSSWFFFVPFNTDEPGFLFFFLSSSFSLFFFSWLLFLFIYFFLIHTRHAVSLAAFARLYNHVGQLFNFGCFANVVEDGEGF